MKPTSSHLKEVQNHFCSSNCLLMLSLGHSTPLFSRASFSRIRTSTGIIGVGILQVACLTRRWTEGWSVPYTPLLGWALAKLSFRSHGEPYRYFSITMGLRVQPRRTLSKTTPSDSWTLSGQPKSGFLSASTVNILRNCTKCLARSK